MSHRNVKVLCDTGLCTFPDYYRPIPSNGWTTTPNVTSIEACAKQASDKLLSGFVTYDIKAKTCVYGPTVTGFFYGNSERDSECVHKVTFFKALKDPPAFEAEIWPLRSR